MMNRNADNMMQAVEKYGFDRRTLLKGLSLFLGGALINTGLSACNSTSYLPESLQGQFQEVSTFQKVWAVPEEAKVLGREIVKVVGHIESSVQDLLKQLQKDLQSKNAGPKELGRAIKKLHLESARQGQWVEVRAWRLTKVEVAAYALCSYEAPK